MPSSDAAALVAWVEEYPYAYVYYRQALSALAVLVEACGALQYGEYGSDADVPGHYKGRVMRDTADALRRARACVEGAGL